MLATFLDHNDREPKQERRRRQRERQKKQSVYISQPKTLHLHPAFLYILSHRCKSATWNFLISRARFMKLVNTAQEFYGPFGFNPRQFRLDFTN